MANEYTIIYASDRSFSHKKLKSIIGEAFYDSDDFDVCDESDTEIKITISGNDQSRIALSKSIDYLLSIASSIKIREI